MDSSGHPVRVHRRRASSRRSPNRDGAAQTFTDNSSGQIVTITDTASGRTLTADLVDARGRALPARGHA